MKQKLLMLLAVLLTGGMLVACGPDEAADEVGGGGVVDEPLEGVEGGALEGDDEEIAGDEAIGDDALNGDVAVGDDEAALEEEPLAEEEEPVAEGESIELNVEDEAAVAEGEEEVAGGAAPAEGELVTITFAEAAEGVAVDNIEGAENAESIAAIGEPNPELTLTTGERYEFAYDGEGDLTFYNGNDEELFSTTEVFGEFESDVQAEAGEGEVAFTVTEQLAQDIDYYTVGPDDARGEVTVD